MNAAEAAVAHDQHVIAGTRRACDRVDQLAEIGVHFRFAAEWRQRLGCVPAEIPGVAIDVVGVVQARRQRRFHRPELHRVRARLHDREDARAADGTAQAVERRRDRRRMVREVVVDGDAADGAARFQPPPHAAKCRERGEALRHRDAGVTRRRERRKRVQLIVTSELAEREHALWRAALQNRSVDGDRPVRPRPGHLG